MSSFGPTVFSIFESEDDAIKILEKIKTSFTSVGFTSFITTANNTGAYIEETSE